MVLDNHSTHISNETVAYLGTRAGRFEYVHTPKHGSWLNLIECAFSKMSRTFLSHIRVKSKQELKTRILKGIAEIQRLTRRVQMEQVRPRRRLICNCFDGTNY